MDIHDLSSAVLELVRRLEPHATFSTLDREFQKIAGKGEDASRLELLALILASLEIEGLIWSEKVGRLWWKKELHFFTCNGRFRRKPKSKTVWEWAKPLPLPQPV